MKRQKSEADSSIPSRAAVKDMWSFSPGPHIPLPDGA